MRKAAKGPSVSSRRFQPADNEPQRIASTPSGLTHGPTPSGPGQFFRFLSVGFTYGYSRFAPSGQFLPCHFNLLKWRPRVPPRLGNFDGTLDF